MKLLAIVASLILPLVPHAFGADDKPLPRGLAFGERFIEKVEIPSGPAPVGPVHALGEWEQADSAMTLWENPSLVRALTERGRVTILADNEWKKQSWLDWLRRNSIGEDNVDFFLVPTDSIWVRDYGPWFIVDGNNRMGIVDTVYNRPRPNDDRVPEFIGRKLNLPVYRSGLVHTGGNFYNDSLGNGFSSTLVHTENPLLSVLAIGRRMAQFLGIKRYTTARLAPKITIEHIDTFGKLVAPDTWVVGLFPNDAPYHRDSEDFVKKLRQLKSPYGTRYKIHRLPLPPSRSHAYRAYINSFIHNGSLFFAAYGDEYDDVARQVYTKALPGYEIVPVDAQGTTWGDSVHCRTRNLRARNTVFIFPTADERDGSFVVRAKIIPSPGARLVAEPVIHFTRGFGRSFTMEKESADTYLFRIEDYDGRNLSYYIEARDSAGIVKRAPIQAPEMTIDYTLED